MFFFLASLVIPYRFRFRPSALFFSALLSILGFLTKPYFILGLGLVWLHLFVFESKSKAVIFGVGAGLGLMASIWVVDLLYECYFTETFFASLASAIHSWTHLRKIGGLFLLQNLGLLLVFAAGLFQSATRRRSEVRRATQQGTEWINWNRFRKPLVSIPGDLPSLVLVCNTAVIVLILGLHPGNDILYYHQLITPLLLWVVVRLADITFKKHWLTSSLLSSNLLILWLCAAPLPPDRSAQWRQLESLVASSADVFAAPHLALLARRSGKAVYDAGQTEFAFAVHPRNFTRVSERYQERNQLFLQNIRRKMRNRQFDLILINPGICPFLPLEELRRYYTPTRVLAAPMPFDSYLRQFPLVQWIPNERPASAASNGVPH